MLNTSLLSPQLRARLREGLLPPTPAALVANHRPLSDEGRQELTHSLRRHFFSRTIWGSSATPEAHLLSEKGRKDLEDNLSGRLAQFRATVIPWLDSVHPLQGARVLEIGSGTGSSTVALAEQGAHVTGIDIEEGSLKVGADRLRLHGLEAELIHANAQQAPERLRGRVFDFIIFFAALEHMTFDERRIAMKGTWEMLRPGAFWCLTDTPNRLWFFDSHTAFLPFYHWLPDDVALAYSRKSPRELFNTAWSDESPAAMSNFLRHGRGISYHDFELAMAPAEELDVVSSLQPWLRARSPAWALGHRFTLAHSHTTLLSRVGPKIHEGFYQSYLDLAIRKR